MYRSVYYLGLAVAVFSLLGLILPRSLSSLTFLLPNGIYAIVSLALALVLMYFAIAKYFRNFRAKLGFGIIGGLLLLYSIIGIFKPTYFGLFSSYMRPANDLMLLISGIGFLIAAIEYNRPSLAEELGFAKISNMYREYNWRLILGLKIHKV